ncbi:MAG: NUDIX hydrolase [Betaproteobacteria bacterium]|nr:NUDIX hydrolase [Betaproteobacteria bacterium]
MGSDPIQKPQPAATVMLLRDGVRGMEVFMIVRHHQSDVHAGALVFPGGRVDPEDYDLAGDAAVFPTQDGMDAATAALRVAAVRETFEECGVLLARARGQGALVSAARLRDIEATHRAAMTRGGRSFGTMLAQENLVLAPETMVYFANWITPERSAKRFDTHFFLAAAPSDQVALHDGHEAVDSVWITPGSALERARAGVYQLRFPTQMNLQKLGRHALSAPAMDAARASRVVTVMTRQERIGDGMRVLRLPLEADYGGELFEVSDPP